MKRKNVIIIISLALLILLGVAVVLYDYLSDDTPDAGAESVESGSAASGESESSGEPNPAPDFTVTDRDGNEIKLSEMTGKPVVLNFWASWCGPCKSEMPDFNEAYTELGGEVCFMMVNLTDGSRETVETASSYVEAQGYSFPVYYDTAGEGADAYDIYSIPCTYFIDADGNMVAYASGAIDGETLRKGIDMICDANG